MQNKYDIQNLSAEFDKEAYVDFLLKKNIDEFLNGVLGSELHPMTDMIREYAFMPEVGSHLVSSRGFYTHHGIYAGDNKVIQYSGYAKSVNMHDTAPNSSDKRSPVEMVTLSKFEANQGLTIEEHPYATYSPQEVVRRAYSRIGEREYNVLFNNCEHFVNWCVYGESSSKQTKTLALSVARITPQANIAIHAYHGVQAIKAYINGDINEEKLFNELSHTASVGVTATYYAIFAQAMIPIPVLGGMIGAFVGAYLGNLLHGSHHFSIIGDSIAVKQAKERRKKVERICNMIIPIMAESRIRLETYIEKYFADRKIIFDEAFDRLDEAIKSNNPDKAIEGLLKINNAYGKELTFKSFDDFDIFMKN